MSNDDLIQHINAYQTIETKTVTAGEAFEAPPLAWTVALRDALAAWQIGGLLGGIAGSKARSIDVEYSAKVLRFVSTFPKR